MRAHKGTLPMGAATGESQRELLFPYTLRFNFIAICKAQWCMDFWYAFCISSLFSHLRRGYLSCALFSFQRYRAAPDLNRWRVTSSGLFYLYCRISEGFYLSPRGVTYSTTMFFQYSWCPISARYVFIDRQVDQWVLIGAAAECIFCVYCVVNHQVRMSCE